MPTSRVETPDGISWHVEQFPPMHSDTTDASAIRYVVLIPSGEGDAGASVPLAKILCSAPYNYHVVTFDMPGFSRTTVSDRSKQISVSAQTLATQIITVVDKLGITAPAVFFGCSSGGIAALGIAAFYPEHVRCTVVHEVPLGLAATSGPVRLFEGKSDEQIVGLCKFQFGTVFVESQGMSKWEGLGIEYHERLETNYVTWAKHYCVVGAEPMLETLAGVRQAGGFKKQVRWTVGALNPEINEDGTVSEEGFWSANFTEAAKLGLAVDAKRLKCLHFPSVTVPEETAKWIAECEMASIQSHS